MQEPFARHRPGDITDLLPTVIPQGPVDAIDIAQYAIVSGSVIMANMQIYGIKLRNHAGTQQVPFTVDGLTEVGHVETTDKSVSFGRGRASNQVPRSKGEPVAIVWY